MSKWWRNNKAASKWTEEEVEAIFEDTYRWVKDQKDLVLLGEVSLYMLETHGVCQTTRSSWTDNIYKNNKSIVALWKYIMQVTENKLVRDNKELRQGIQTMVLQNKHNFTEKREETHSGSISVKHTDLEERIKNLETSNKKPNKKTSN